MIPLTFLTTPSTIANSQRNRLPSTCTRRVGAARPMLTPTMGMSVKTEPLPNSQLRIQISVEAEDCMEAWNSVLKEVSKKSTLKGFRKGKAPKQMVINEFGKDRLLASACEDVIEKSISKAIEEEKISVIGQAQVDDDGGVESIIETFSPEAPLIFNVKVDIWPEPKFTSSYENMQIEAEEVPLNEQLVEKSLEELQRKESFSVLSPQGTTAQLGKMVVGDLEGFYRNDDGSLGEKLPELANGENVEINMTEGQYMPGFVEGLIGAEVGETRDVNVEFPAQNPRKELAGRKAIFRVEINAIKDVILPELNDDFAMGISEEKTLEDLKTAIRGRLGTETENEQRKQINSAIETHLASIVEVEIPETLVENQVKNKFANMLASFKDKGMADDQVKAMVTKENYELYKKRSLPNVEKSLKVNFAVGKIAKDKGIVIEKSAIDDQMALVKAELKGEEVEEDKVRDQIEGQLEREEVFDLLKKTAQITLVPAKKEKEAEAPAAQTV